jgi:membrane associated rhomboid family serine protease
MDDLHTNPLQGIVLSCAVSAPQPWYPGPFAEARGIPREQLDRWLDELRLAGLIRLTDWVQGQGQGYILTPAGQDVVNNPRLLEKVQAGQVPRVPAAAPATVVPQPRRGMNAWERGEAIRAALLYPARPVVTYALIAANVVVFCGGLALAQRAQIPLNKFVAGGHAEILEAMGAVRADDVLSGDWWRLLTACFVHVGLLHLGMNMYALYVLGPVVERLFGHVRFLVLYLVAGFGGSCIGMLLSPGAVTSDGRPIVLPDLRLGIPLAGASGALCGLLGAIATWTYLNRRSLPPALVASWLRVVLINAVLIAFISALPNVSWSGHLGGAAVGLLAAGLLNFQRFGVAWQRVLASVGLLLLPVVCYVVLIRAPTFDKRWAEAVDAYEKLKAIRKLRAGGSPPPSDRFVRAARGRRGYEARPKRGRDS